MFTKGNNKRKILKIFSIFVILIPGIFFISFFIFTKIFNIEKQLLYHPTYAIKPVNSELKNKTEIKSFYAPGKIKLTYWHIKGDKNKPVIVFCHGHYFNVSYFQNKIAFLSQKGYEVFMLDYRGFGKSKGTPDEKGLYTDIESFVKYLGKSGISQNKIVLWGHSLGGGVVTDVASKYRFRGVILEGTFTSIKDIKISAANSLRSYPSGYFDILYANYIRAIPITQKFDNSKKIGNISSPLLIIHSKNDEIIPVEMGYKLAKLNPRAELYISERGDHDSLGWQNMPILNYLNSLK